MSNTLHTAFMHRCLELARQGKGHVSPNPMVGCVVVSGDKIIGEGWHQQYGGPHAEVNAIADVEQRSGGEALRAATLYVNLEPCSHWGKTPPCDDLIVAKGIPRVVVGCVDPNEKVSGHGIERLRAAGIEVEVGVLEADCQRLNRRFFTVQTLGRPYVILKWAQTCDGYLDAVRPSAAIPPAWMTGPEARALVHRWRSQEDAILVGQRTVELDNPSLTVRDWPAGGRNPLRVVIGRSTDKLPRTLKIFGPEAPTLTFNLPDFGHGELLGLLERLQKEHGTQSLIVEGGAVTLRAFISAGLWDEARVFTATDRPLSSLYPAELLSVSESPLTPQLLSAPIGLPAPVLSADHTLLHRHFSLGPTEVALYTKV